MTKIIAFFTALWTFLCPFTLCPKTEVSKDEWDTNYSYVFVHGLSGWGSYDSVNKIMPYWGMFGGNLHKYLKKQGFNCYAASVAPQGSAWDRACELYAQLTGTVTDYGEAHSKECNHERYGTDFTGKALIKQWDSENKINLLGHSFGGATVRMLVSLMAQGDENERAASGESVSPLFTGGKADWVYSVTTLAAPHNGTTAYNVDDSENAGSDMDKAMAQLVEKANETEDDGRARKDYADYDMYIDNALELNKKLALPENVYYFSVACTCTKMNEDGTYSPDRSRMEALFVSSAEAIGHYTGATENGFVIDEAWRENDGLVNTCSAKAPMYQPSAEFEKNNIQSGIWLVMPVFYGDHMSLQGGMFVKNDMRAYYANHMNMINSI
ncbi:MAG: hypothetical protein MJ177_00035 [Clostridia bacterium]|nr:hypothetical protein [Clostridia bacterium]